MLFKCTLTNPSTRVFLGEDGETEKKKRGRAREKEKEGMEIGRDMEREGEKKEVRGKKR